jgi:hypothetical protein
MTIVTQPFSNALIIVDDSRSWRSRSLNRFGRVRWEPEDGDKDESMYIRPRLKPVRHNNNALMMLTEDEAYGDFDIVSTETAEKSLALDSEGDDELRPTRPESPSREAAARNEKPQQCRFDIAETLPDGLYNLTRPLDHLTIHEVCFHHPF